VILLQEATVALKLSPEEKYISASYLYYWLDLSPITDQEYDELVKYLHDNYENTAPWLQKRVTKEDLTTGSGYFLKYSDAEMDRAEEWAEELGLM